MRALNKLESCLFYHRIQSCSKFDTVIRAKELLQREDTCSLGSVNVARNPWINLLAWGENFCLPIDKRYSNWRLLFNWWSNVKHFRTTHGGGLLLLALEGIFRIFSIYQQPEKSWNGHIEICNRSLELSDFLPKLGKRTLVSSWKKKGRREFKNLEINHTFDKRNDYSGACRTHEFTIKTD